MTIRLKITLLITLAGFISSSVFSAMMLMDMREQPIRLVESNLEIVSRRAVELTAGREKEIGFNRAETLDVNNNWLIIFDEKTGTTIYKSHLAQLVNLQIPEKDFNGNISVVVSPETMQLGQDAKNEVTFRVKTFRINSGGRLFRVVAAHSIEHLEEELQDMLLETGISLAFSILLLVAISYFIAGLVLRPVREINRRSREINENLLDRRLPVSNQKDEFNSLARTLNRVFDRLQYAFDRQKKMIADASHELKTPLAIIRLILDEIETEEDGPPKSVLNQKLGRISNQTLRMQQLVKSLLDLSTLESIEKIDMEEFDLNPLLTDLIDDYRILAETRGIQIEFKIPENVNVKGNKGRLTQVFSNTLDNAIRYNMDGGNVSLDVISTEPDVTIVISNTGPGVARSSIPNVFDQFFRAEQSRSSKSGNYGLGLTIVKRIVGLHNGSISFESWPGGMTQVSINLPQ